MIEARKPLSQWFSQAQERLVTEVLPNGLTVMCYPMPDTYKVQVGITYDVGGKNEQPHECGLAHMVEHMMFKGTDKMSETGLKAIAHKYHLGDIGQGYNAATSADLTRYYFNADKNNWPVFLNILADCMFNVRFDENHFASEVKAVIEELNLRSTNLFAIIGDELCSLIYPHNHPYHHPVGGYKEVLLNATSKDLKAFYKRNYGPAKALLTIVGDINVEEALAAARKTFATEGYKPTPENEVQVIPTLDFAQKKITLYKPIPKAQYTYLWKMPQDPLTGDYAQCLSWVLTKRLEKLLVDQKDLVYSVAASSLQRQLGGVFFYTFDLKNQAKLKEVKELITNELEKLKTEGPTQTELDSFKKLSEVAFFKLFEHCSTLSATIEHEYFPTRSTDTFFGTLDRIKGITKDAIKGFIKAYLTPSSKYSILCLPIPEAEQAQWLSKKQEEDTYEQTILQRKMRETSVESARYPHDLPDSEILAAYVAEKPDKVVTLKNGLTVYIKKSETTPFITSALQFKTSELFGMAQSSKHQSMVRLFAMNSIASSLQTSKYTKEQNQEFFDLRGAQVAISATGGTINCLSEDYPDIAARALHILKDCVYDAKIFSQERNSLIEQFTMAKMKPEYMADRLLVLELFKDYPWMESDEELCKQLKALTRSDLLTFNKRYINPANMFMVMVGNLDLATIESELERVFGTWKQDPEYKPLVEQTLKVPDITAQKGTEILRPIPVDQVYLAFGRVTDYYGSKDTLALKLIESYLFNKIFEIREQTGAFYTCMTSLGEASIHQKGAAKIIVPLSVNNVTVVENAIKELLRSIAQQGIPQEKLDNEKLFYQVQLLKSKMTNEARLARFCGIISDDRPMDIVEKRLAMLQALTKEEVDEVARKYFDPSQWTVVKAGRIEQDSLIEKASQQQGQQGEKKEQPGFLSWLLAKLSLSAA